MNASVEEMMNAVMNNNSEVLDSSGCEYDVSICIITYNKEKYIADAIESVLMQKTTCRYEIVIGDNASTDQTPNILRKYWGEAPERFSVIFNMENLGLSTNMFYTMCKAKGKYIVILYGDDYWTDENKLQIMFDFLETHTQYIGVSAPIAFIYDGEKEAFRVEPPKFLWNKTGTLETYLKGFNIPMAGLMFRNNIFSESYDHFHKMVEAHKDIDDASFCILILMKGDVFVLNQVFEAYRCFRKDGGADNFNSVNPAATLCTKTVNLYAMLNELTGGTLNLDIRYGFVIVKAMKAFIRNEMSWTEYKHIKELIKPELKGKYLWVAMKCFQKKVTGKIPRKNLSV